MISGDVIATFRYPFPIYPVRGRSGQNFRLLLKKFHAAVSPRGPTMVGPEGKFFEYSGTLEAENRMLPGLEDGGP